MTDNTKVTPEDVARIVRQANKTIRFLLDQTGKEHLEETVMTALLAGAMLSKLLDEQMNKEKYADLGKNSYRILELLLVSNERLRALFEEYHARRNANTVKRLIARFQKAGKS